MDITNLSEQELLELIKQVRDEGKGGTQPVVETPGATEKPVEKPAEAPKFTIKIGGRDFSGTQDEIQQAIAAEEKRTPPHAPKQERKVTATDYDPEEVRAELAKRLEKDPLDAWRFMNKRAFGVDDPAEVVRALTQVATEQQIQLSAVNFRLNHPEWEPEQKNVDALNAVMAQHNIPPTNLELAYQLAKSQGLLTQPTEEAKPEVPAEPKAPRPPRVSRTSTQQQDPSPDELDSMFANMSAEELRALDMKLRYRK